MKKVALYTVALMGLLLSVSCTVDELNESDFKKDNKEINAHGDISVTPPPKKNG